MKERDLYKPIANWLHEFLKGKFPNREIKTVDSSQVYLSDLIYDLGLTKYFPQYRAYEIKVDVTGFAISEDSVNLALVECKLGKIGLREVSQLLGYCIIAKPDYAFIISPAGISSAMSYILRTLRNYDILRYHENKMIRVCKWDTRKNDIVRPTIPPL